MDLYIGKSADFAKPVLAKLRQWVHQAAPELDEDIKWGMPAFMYKGIVANMAAFKNHVSFGFWKGKLMRDEAQLFEDAGRTQITAFKITSVDDLPDQAVFSAYLREAIDLNERGIKLPTAKKNEARKLDVPDDLAGAFKQNPEARAVFDAFSYTHRKEYIDWLTGAKRDETRARRLETAIKWISEGKPRNWKYMKR